MAEGANTPIQLLVGLGNPGPTYAETRHNAGAWLLERFCQSNHLDLKTETKFHARVGKTTFNGKEVKILIPTTFMNHSGQAVGAISKYYNIPLNAILIAHDDLDIPTGCVRLKTGGGHGGHNGLRDIIHHLGGREFHRLRIGIGHPGHKDHVLDYVLHRPSKHEEQQINLAIDEVLGVLPKIIQGEWSTVMNQLHSFSGISVKS